MLVITKQICEILKGQKKQKENKLDEKAKLYLAQTPPRYFLQAKPARYRAANRRYHE